MSEEDPTPASEEPKTSVAKDWDPEPGQRIYVSSSTTGDMGWIVRRGGRDKVRLDRPNQEITVDYNGTWTQVVEHRRASHAQVVMVAFEADKALLKLLGEYQKAKKEFRDLTEKQLAAWIEEGPTQPPIRAMFYRTVVDFLEEHLVG